VTKKQGKLTKSKRGKEEKRKRGKEEKRKRGKEENATPACIACQRTCQNNKNRMFRDQYQVCGEKIAFGSF
jgi:hypothetical protein